MAASQLASGHHQRSLTANARPDHPPANPKQTEANRHNLLFRQAFGLGAERVTRYFGRIPKSFEPFSPLLSLSRVEAKKSLGAWLPKEAPATTLRLRVSLGDRAASPFG